MSEQEERNFEIDYFFQSHSKQQINNAKLFLEEFQNEYKQESKEKAFSTLHFSQECLTKQEKKYFFLLKEMKRLNI